MVSSLVEKKVGKKDVSEFLWALTHFLFGKKFSIIKEWNLLQSI